MAVLTTINASTPVVNEAKRELDVVELIAILWR
eukprot:CAMPEP_0198580826 /NCGR_PEP_ID=MMETSP1462-20131121/123396_1 /TAXON_ID=1333877 /ORGANISM="Brandtodinium nutriculum, Strain RCC3387" /LENGTH=32 /DNA_ID= /DNA_START= /DNA_END= /DNA_ORIENTATION=